LTLSESGTIELLAGLELSNLQIAPKALASFPQEDPREGFFHFPRMIDRIVC
jgi:hypothetical protein